ncbi:MAG TPA: cell division protein ZapB [Candidatus Eisenbacteria bacterium]|jgi:chromosome segregation ATPase|nr:cell division protein ZapB [Candidatus Eisenbacteria bacterium]
MMAELDQLEERIHAAVGLLEKYREEKRRLEHENGELKERVHALEVAAGKQAEDLKPKIQALEDERTTLLDERRVVARRVEEMMSKLDQLHKAVHA